LQFFATLSFLHAPFYMHLFTATFIKYGAKLSVI